MTKRAISTLIDAALTGGGSSLLDKYRGREIEFFRDRGRVYPEVLEELFWAIFRAENPDLVVIGPRDGGKTMGVSDAAAAAFAFRGFDVFQIGGSAAQAQKGFDYARDILYGDPEMEGALADELKTCATGVSGNWYKIAAASQKAVRGQHPGDPHRGTGFKNHGGILIKDERDEMDDSIADAADLGMGHAEPGVTVTTSTMHRADGGGIAMMAEEATQRGARVIKFDVFDVCQVCTHDCARCPGGQAFAGPLWGATEKPARVAKGQKGKAPEAEFSPIPEVTAESLAGWEKWKGANNFPADEPGYCEGRAKRHRAGHLKMEKIFNYAKKLNRETFEVELCCRRRRGAGPVLDSAKLDLCLDSDVVHVPGNEVVATVDWGFKGVCVVNAVEAQMNSTYAVVDTRYFQQPETDDVAVLLEGWREQYGIYEVFADSSHPAENKRLREQSGFDVTEVNFAQWKAFGAGWLKLIVERVKLRIPGKLVPARREDGTVGKAEYVFQSDDAQQLFKQLKKWRRDKNGQIVKKDDHGPDSLLCAAVKFGEEEPWEPEVQGGGSRASAKL